MNPFLYDPAVTPPLDVVRRDYMKFFVESIVDHRGNIKKNGVEILSKLVRV
jgi:hypothetical protein